MFDYTKNKYRNMALNYCYSIVVFVFKSNLVPRIKACKLNTDLQTKMYILIGN